MFLSILCRELVPWLGFEVRGMNASLELARSIGEKKNATQTPIPTYCLVYRRWNDLLICTVIIAYFT